jgi:hypothetical protein
MTRQQIFFVRVAKEVLVQRDQLFAKALHPEEFARGSPSVDLQQV